MFENFCSPEYLPCEEIKPVEINFDEVSKTTNKINETQLELNYILNNLKFMEKNFNSDFVYLVSLISADYKIIQKNFIEKDEFLQKAIDMGILIECQTKEEAINCILLNSEKLIEFHTQRINYLKTLLD